VTGSVVTIGAFDGVHLGHRWLLGQVVDRARQLGTKATVVTFHPHPDLVLYPERQLSYLTDREEKERLIGEIGADQVWTMEFTRELSMLRPEEFLNLIQARAPIQELWIGPDFAMGRGRAGTASALAELGREWGFALHMVPPARQGDEVVSSTFIRNLLAEGEVEHANKLLGRPFGVCGMVVQGAQRGRELGFPTANIEPPAHHALPADGVYAAEAEWNGGRARAVVNLGGRPTFGEAARLLEAHLIDVDADLYGQRLCVRFTRRLRGVMKFASIEALKAQIAADRDAAAAEAPSGA
jgi:riboflavin kinase/FMN adenylyltransferase